MEYKYSISNYEFIRQQMKQEFNVVKESWLDLVHWTIPYCERYLTGAKDRQGERNNQHIIDPAHILALRSYVAGFLEGNTSTSRAWFKMQHPDPAMRRVQAAKEWIGVLTERMLHVAGTSNMYHALAEAYLHYGVVNTAVMWIDETKFGPHFSTLTPGSYYLANDAFQRANVLVRDFQLNVKALVDNYGEYKNGRADWSNFSSRVRKLYEQGDYKTKVDVTAVVKENDMFSTDHPNVKLNRKWHQVTYESSELGQAGRAYMVDPFSGVGLTNPDGTDKFLKIGAFTRKPFIAFRSTSVGNCPYGEWGPTVAGYGLIRSANFKAKSKDKALNQMVEPTTIGPASLKKQYITTAPGMHIPVDPLTARTGSDSVRRLFEINPAIGALVQDTEMLHSQIGKIYYQDFLLYLTSNPKTRTAAEVQAVQMEQQLVIGPNLQSLNHTLNKPLVEYLAEYVIENDPYLPSLPADLGGESIDPVFISLFAQAQKSADLPSIDRFVNMVAGLAPTDAAILDKLDSDFLADLYEDRLYLPPGLVRGQAGVDAIREKREADISRQQKLTEVLPALAGAAKNLNINKGG